MSDLSNTYNSNLSSRARDIVLSLVHTNDEAPIRELKELIHANPELGSLTLDELFAKSAKPKSKTKPAGAVKPGDNAPGNGTPAKVPVQDYNVRTAPGRQALDAEVLRVLKQQGGEDVQASTIRPVIGVSDAQLRTSLNRLIAEGQVTYTGLARATRYSLA